MKEYKAVIYQENLLSSLVFGSAKINPVKFSDFLNSHASQGWKVVTMEKDQRRMLLFFVREPTCHFGKRTCLNSASMPVSDYSKDWSHDNQRFLEHH